MKKGNYELFLAAALFLLLCTVAISVDTTGDAGDSITHYLYSHYAFKYPQFFFDHWAKPVFVLLTAPFAQGGFVGLQIFNCLCVVLTALFTFYSARNLKIKEPYLVFIFFFFAPLYFKLIFSGLTEYLFGLVLILGIYFESRLKHIPALIIISFLPLIRSEGLIIVAVFILYYLLNKKYKLLPYLLCGQLLYSIVGIIYYKNIFWVFSEIPYASMESPYGSGKLIDFVHRLNYVIEKPIYILLLIGLLSLVYQTIKKGLRANNRIMVILVAGSFLAFFIAHSIFWWQGIFNSMGLPRVLISVVPLVALIGLIGFQTVTDAVTRPVLRSLASGIILLIICLYPFTPRSKGIVYDKLLFSLPENELVKEEVLPYIKKEIPDYRQHFFYYSHPYFSIALNIDPFDYNHHKEMKKLFNEGTPPTGAIVVWDDWYAVTEGRVSLEQMMTDKNFELLRLFERKEKNRTIKFAVFRSKAWH